MRRATSHRQAGEKNFAETVESDIRREVDTEAGRLVGAGALDDFQAVQAEAHRATLAVVGCRPKIFTTALGPMPLEGAWHHCDVFHAK
ncbi:MAG: hypothetical protein OXE83_05715 [Gammaproteobacteria bacterium]|nr:hypothetical protein [Gammaproteobacteria bacterium]